MRCARLQCLRFLSAMMDLHSLTAVARASAPAESLLVHWKSRPMSVTCTISPRNSQTHLCPSISSSQRSSISDLGQPFPATHRHRPMGSHLKSDRRSSDGASPAEEALELNQSRSKLPNNAEWTVVHKAQGRRA